MPLTWVKCKGKNTVTTLKLFHPVYTRENQLLLPAGTALSTDTMDALIESNSAKSYQTYSILNYGNVKNDVLRLVGKPPYNSIFSDEKKIAETLNLMETVRLVLPVLQSLDYFKQYDYHTYCHTLMVFALSTLLAKDLVPDCQEQTNEVATSPTHDIGKTCVPLDILKKNAPLTRREKNIIEHHSAAGYVLLSYFYKDYENLAAVVARDHHERGDGSGCPRGIKLTDSMVEIIVVCDIYDALVSPRPYRPVSYDNRTALEEITKMAEMNKIDWKIVKALVSHNRKRKTDYNETKVSTEKRGSPPSCNLYGVVEEGDSGSRKE